MRKLLIAGSLILILALSVAGILYYRTFFLPVMENMDSFKEMAKLGEFNDQITNRGPFTPPDDNRITASQLERFLAVQREIRIEAGASFDTVRARLDFPPDSLKGEPVNPWVHWTEFGTYRGIVTHMTRVKEEQVQALNRHDFSLAEYRWVRESLLRAMGRKSDFYVEDLGAAPDSGAGAHPAAKSEPRVHPENVALVRAAADSLAAWLPISILGF